LKLVFDVLTFLPQKFVFQVPQGNRNLRSGAIGIAWEHIVNLANLAQKDVWISNFTKTTKQEIISMLILFFRHANDRNWCLQRNASRRKNELHGRIGKSLQKWKLVYQQQRIG